MSWADTRTEHQNPLYFWAPRYLNKIRLKQRGMCQGHNASCALSTGNKIVVQLCRELKGANYDPYLVYRL
jgi:hypothetical protein